MGKQRHMRHHFVIDKLIPGGDLGGAVEHQNLAEKGVLEQDEMLVLRVSFVKHPVGLIAHAKAEVVEQGFRDGTLHVGLQATNTGGMVRLGGPPALVVLCAPPPC